MRRDEIKYVAPEKLVPYEKNNKIHNDDQLKKLVRSIKEIGFRTPILVDENRVILAGHGRVAAAIKAKLKEVPVVQYTDLTEEQKKKFRILDNRLGDLAEYDIENLRDELREIDDQWLTDMFKELDLGLDKEDEWNEETEDDVPEVDEEEETIVKEGDVFELDGKIGKHYVLCGDATKLEDYEKLKELLGINAFDMLFTDPPYNVNYKGKGKNTSRGIINDHMGNANFYQFLLDTFEPIEKSTKPTAPMYIFHSSTTQAQFEKAMNENGIEVISQLIWNKPTINHVGAKYKAKHEPFFYARKKKQKEERYGDDLFEQTVQDVPDVGKMKTMDIVEAVKHTKAAEAEGWTTIWSMKRHNVNDYIHPTQKPVEIVEKAIYNSSKQGDAILEPFGGSGTTLMAAEKTARRCGLIELDPHFIQATLKRYAKQTGKAIKCLNRDIDLYPILA